MARSGEICFRNTRPKYVRNYELLDVLEHVYCCVKPVDELKVQNNRKRSLGANDYAMAGVNNSHKTRWKVDGRFGFPSPSISDERYFVSGFLSSRSK